MKRNPRETASLPSKLFFCWVWNLLCVGWRRDLEIDDLYQVVPGDQSTDLGNKLQAAWDSELGDSGVDSGRWEEVEVEREEEPLIKGTPRGRKPQFGRALFRVFGLYFSILGFIAFVDECVIKILQPICLGYLIRYFGGEFSPSEGYLYAGGVILCSAWFVTQHHPYFFGLSHIGMRSRVAVTSLVYRKALRLSSSSLRTTTVGQMVNFLSNDVSRFDQAPLMSWYLVVGPIQLAIVIYILWGYYSYVCLVGVGFLILFVPFQSFMGHLFGKMRLTVAGRTDRRIRIMNEIVTAIRVIKMYTWEEPFSKLVTDAREDEVGALRTVADLKAMNYSVYYVSSKVVIFLTLLTYVLTGNYLTAEQVFVTSALYNNVRQVLTLFFPYGMSNMAELLISIRRLENFLLLEEKSPHPGIRDMDSGKGSTGLSLRNLSAKWIPELDEWTLENVSLEAKSGTLIGIIGTVGSSKSSLLQSILGELPPLSGQVEVRGQLAFAPQEPWIFSGTLRENILLGKPYESTWYGAVVGACALKRDFQLLPHGDSSLVGDRGISLSGGQKARVSLARALYADRDIYLLDDPLSAVDAEVGKHLFDKVIRGLLRNKTVLLVTHQLQFIHSADEILVMKGGRVEVQGTFLQLQESGLNLNQLLQTETEENLDQSLEITTPFPEYRNPFENNKTSGEGKRSQGQMDPLKGDDDEGGSIKTNYGTFEENQVDKKGGGRVDKETKSSGGIPLSLYWKYIRSGSGLLSISFLSLMALLTQVFLTGSDYWLQFWTEIEEKERVGNGTVPLETGNVTMNWTCVLSNLILTDRSVQIGIYCGIIATLFLVSLFRTITFTHICLRASISLHRGLFEGVLRSPMKFFETNPIGRILNRFARDVGVIDEYLPFSLFDAWDIPFQAIGIFVVIGLMSPLLILPAILLLLVFYKVRNYYLQTARSLKRLESITRSPVFTHLSSSFHGLTTIRALGVEKEFCNQFDKLQDQHSACWYLFLSTSRWMGITLDWIALLYVTIVTFSFMGSNLNGSQVGLAVSSALTLTGLFQWGVRQSAEAENHMVSVERVIGYSELPPEPPLHSTPGHEPPPDWPSRGQIKIRNLFLSYGNSDPVLKDISILIKPMEKIGIVGRTGAGKSSIISALFRLVEFSGGGIEIDGLDISSIGLHDLRSKISIIPQEPVLFVGSLRRNLDPFDEFSDGDLWDVLGDVHLRESIQELVLGLYSPISEGGSNFSVGEKQLICLARAILRKNKILVLDEATANVDPKTDGLIQATIRNKFLHCTVLTVAHRLQTVMDSDRILLLEGGRVVEFDSPWSLVQNQRGALYQLTQQTGGPTAEALIRMAREAFEGRENNQQNQQE